MPTAADLGPIEEPGEIGNYRLREKIGEGGMGIVYDAEQVHPVRRRVALKLVKWGMDTREVVARFEAERQALALMDHPNIARVFDAGATDRGRPYFVMEFVEGTPITDYCDAHRLDTVERIELFRKICDAVQHAHQRGIIHRDLKPSNVLVAEQDGDPVPKVIDFGVAKATSKQLTERTVFTELGQMIGTPEYMSPEQADLKTLDLDTRTDVYSLGILLYELLVGALPFDAQALREAGWDEMRRIVREEDPPRPSTRVSTLGESSAEEARKRHTDPRSLSRQLRGDLDWIVMRAIEKERNRRYGTASELAADLVRHLRHEPVLAGPPGVGYRMRKFVLRHKVGVGVSAVGLLLLVGFAVRERMQSARIAGERDRANREAETARQVSDFLIGLFEVSDPGEARGNSITAREILDRGAERIDEELEDQPRVRARMMDTVGVVYQKLGLYDRAAPLLESALSIRERVLPGNDPDLAQTLNDLGVVYWKQGEYDRSKALLQRALDIREASPSPGSLEVALTLSNLAGVHADQGDFELAEPLFRRSMEIEEEVLGHDHPRVARRLNNLAHVYATQGRYDESEDLQKRALSILERALEPDHPDLGVALIGLSALYQKQGRHEDAEPPCLRALEIFEKSLGPDHPNVAATLSNLGGIYQRQGRDDRAEASLKRALAVRERALGPNHPDLAKTQSNLGVMFMEQGRYGEAAPLFERSLKIFEDALGPDHPNTAVNVFNLADLYLRQERYPQAEPLFRRSLEVFEKTIGPNHPYVAEAARSLAVVHREQGEFGQAEPLFARALEVLEGNLGPSHPKVAQVLQEMAVLYRKTGREAEADETEARARATGEDAE